MKPTVSTVATVAAVAWSLFGVAAQAGDLGSGSSSAGAQAPSKVDQEIDQAVGQGGSSSSGDVDAQIKDLEATRTEINQKRPPAVSLGVSGWVTQEIQINGKQ